MLLLLIGSSSPGQRPVWSIPGPRLLCWSAGYRGNQEHLLCRCRDGMQPVEVPPVCPRCQYNTDVTVSVQNHNHNIW